MLHRILLIGALLGAATLSIGHAADLTEGMKKGTPDLKSAGPATFAPQGILLLGDSQGATVFAIATGDTASGSPAQPLNIERIDEQIAALLGTSPKEITINDLAVNPETGNAFLTVSRGTGPAAKPVIIRVDASGKLGEFSLADKLFSQASIPNAAQDKGRQEVTTDLQFVDGQVIVAGLSNEEFASQLRVLAFPFAKVEPGASVEIFHGAHGKYETRSPVRTFAVYNIGGSRHSNCSVLEAIALIQEITGRQIDYTLSDENRSGDHIWWISDVRRFQADYPEWEYAYGLREMVEEIVEAASDRFVAQ